MVEGALVARASAIKFFTRVHRCTPAEALSFSLKLGFYVVAALFVIVLTNEQGGREERKGGQDNIDKATTGVSTVR